MNEDKWRAIRDSRTISYGGRLLNPSRPVMIRIGSDQATRYDGQVTLLVLANLLSRMTPKVTLQVPDVEVSEGLPWSGQRLQDQIREQMYSADPYGQFRIRSNPNRDDFLSAEIDGSVDFIHGSGWNFCVAPTVSPVPASPDLNPIGPSLAAIVAVARMVNGMEGPRIPFIANGYDWSESLQTTVPSLDRQPELGDIWTVGVGSVGTAVLFFLCLATNRFSATTFDMDEVEIHNLDRSPLFTVSDVGTKKVEATAKFLHQAGVIDVHSEPVAFDESSLWRNRQPGVPDILVPTANERNVRQVIEAGFPPVQIYGTTGRNWQASLLRHIPLVDPCSTCLFADAQQLPTLCATGWSPDAVTSEETVDASLPFLSFAAGAMAAAEILKLSLPGYPFAPNRTFFYTRPHIRLVSAGQSLRHRCMCGIRSQSVHRKMISGSQFRYISDLRTPDAGFSASRSDGSTDISRVR